MVVDIAHAKLDPARTFLAPESVLNEASLSREEKIDILQRWAYDERELAVAEEENMQGIDSTHHSEMLQKISQALLQLGVRSDDQGHPPTKQG
jgi:hypothetical protein